MALAVFPTEVWEVIMGNLTASTDILNTFQAFPELETEGVLRTKRHLWLFERVVPHIFPWLIKEDEKRSEMWKQYEFPRSTTGVILTCRLVCTQWCQGVDNFLENNSTRRAYSHEEQDNGQLWIPEASPRYYRLPNYFIHVDPFNRRTGRFTEFLQLIDGHPPEKNPTPGRSIKISDRYGGGINESYFNNPVNKSKYWNEVVDVLRKFGEHVWFLNLEYKYRKDPILFCQLVMDCLGLVSNLKSLEIGYFSCFDSKKRAAVDQFLNSGTFFLPKLPYLETLELDHDVREEWSFPPTLWNKMVKTYHSQIRRLRLNMFYWRKEYADLFPNLTELCISDVMSRGDALSDFISSVKSPDLWKLKIKFKTYFRSHEINLSKLIPLLKKFKKLHTLNLSLANCLESSIIYYEPCERDSNVLTSIKNLEIEGRDQKLKTNLLQYFPALEHLKILHHGRPQFSNELYDTKVWDSLLSKLKTICVEDSSYSSNFKWHYSRELYLRSKPKKENLCPSFDSMTVKQREGKQGKTGKSKAPKRKGRK